MADFEINENALFSDTMRKLEVTDKAHADLFNKHFKTLLDNDNHLKKNEDIIRKELSSDAEAKVSEHNASEEAHADIRNLVTTLTTRLNTLADSDDTTLDQLSEIVAYIKNNKSLIDGITTNKVNMSDIIDNLTSSAVNKPLAARQGKVLKDLITVLTSTVEGKVNKTGDTMTGDLVIPVGRANTNRSVPVSGRLDSILIPQGLSEIKTFIGSVSDEKGVFWNIISTRHGNGHQDGNLYGMYLRSLLTDTGSHGGSLLWNKQMGSGNGWLGERILLDSVNYKDFCLPLSGGTMNDDVTVVFKSGNGIGTGLEFRGGTYRTNIRPAELILSNGNKQIYIMQGDGIRHPSIKLIDVDSTHEFDENVEISSSFINIIDDSSGEKLQINADSIRTKTTFAINTNNVNNHSLIVDGSNKSVYSGIAISDEKYNLGTANRKWNDIYAQNGVIQTSDRTRKTDINNLETQKAQSFINGLNPVSYKMIDGTSGRTHYGFIAQDIEELMNTLNMDSSDFAGFIKSPKKTIKYEDKNGNKLKKPIEEIIEGEYDYSLRYDEFIAPLIKVVQEQQKMIEQQQRIIEQQQIAIKNQQKEIEQIKKAISKMDSLM